MKLKVRAIRIVIALDRTNFQDSDANTKEIMCYSLPNSLHCDVKMSQKSFLYGNTGEITIYGMNREDCFSATKFNFIVPFLYNEVKVYAGYLDDDAPIDDREDLREYAKDTLPLVFSGYVSSAGVDMNDVDRPFKISATIGSMGSFKVLADTVINEPTTFQDMVKTIVAKNNDISETKYNVVLRDNSISTTIVASGHYQGTLVEQLANMVNDYGYNYIFLFDTIYLSSLKVTSSINTKTISKSNGMIGYPTVKPLMFEVASYFRPDILPLDTVFIDTEYAPLNNTPESPNKGNDYVYQIWGKESSLSTQGEDWYSKYTINTQGLQSNGT